MGRSHKVSKVSMKKEYGQQHSSQSPAEQGPHRLREAVTPPESSVWSWSGSSSAYTSGPAHLDRGAADGRSWPRRQKKGLVMKLCWECADATHVSTHHLSETWPVSRQCAFSSQAHYNPRSSPLGGRLTAAVTDRIMEQTVRKPWVDPHPVC